jgi:hypothetical protein
VEVAEAVLLLVCHLQMAEMAVGTTTVEIDSPVLDHVPVVAVEE